MVIMLRQCAVVLTTTRAGGSWTLAPSERRHGTVMTDVAYFTLTVHFPDSVSKQKFDPS